MNTVWCLFGIAVGLLAAISAFLGGIWYQITFKVNQGFVARRIKKTEATSTGKPIIIEGNDPVQEFIDRNFDVKRGEDL